MAARGLVIEQRAVLHHQLVALEHEASARIVEQRIGERIAVGIGAADGADRRVGGGVFRDGGGAERERVGLAVVGDVGERDGEGLFEEMALKVLNLDLDAVALRRLVIEQCAAFHQQLVAEHVEASVRIVGQRVGEFAGV